MTSGRAQAVRVGVGAVVLLVGGGYAASTLSSEAETGSEDGATGHLHGADHHAAHRVVGDGRTAAAGEYRLAGVRLDDGGLSFRVLDVESGEPVADYAVVHEKQLHLFVFRTDLHDFQHVHPTLRGGDRWQLALGGLQPGRHRVVAEFTPEGEDSAVMLGAGVSVPGATSNEPLPPPSTSVEVEGYTVSVRGSLELGLSSELEVTITDGSGEPAVLEPYLDSWSHAALLHKGSLAVAHLHPAEEYVEGGASPDGLTLATPAVVSGAYRLVVEFAAEGRVHQAELTMPAA